MQSTNGTYVNVDQYIQNDEPLQLRHGDIICFGFDISKVYDINDRNVLIYRVVHDTDLETIQIFDSDEEDDDVDNDAVICLDSDSEAMSELNSAASSDEDDEEYGDEDVDQASEFEVGEEKFVADDNEPQNENGVHSTSDDMKMLGVNTEDDQEELAHGNGTLKEEPSVSENEAQATKAEPAETRATKAEPAETQATETDDAKPKLNEEEEKLERVRQFAKANQPKAIPIINPQPIRKRRKTITQQDYQADPKKFQPSCSTGNPEFKKMRAELLAKVAIEQNAKKAATQQATNEPRSKTTPKVKITTNTRSDLLTNDFTPKNCQ